MQASASTPPTLSAAAAETPDETIATAVEISEEDAEFGGAGVIVTGSVVTAGEARTLLRRGR